MKPQLLKVNTLPTNSFSVRQDMVPNINNRWHYHSEVELIQFHKGSGTQFVGDNIRCFGPGDIVLVGSNLPHYWRYDETCFNKNDSPKPYSSVVHFTENFWGDSFLDLPELRHLKGVLEKAKRGILVPAQKAKDIARLIKKIHLTDGLERMIALMQCLSAFAKYPHAIILSSIGFQLATPLPEADRINEIYYYSFAHFKNKVTLNQISNLVGLSPNSFCRYFKNKTGKNYLQFLTEIRIGYACKLIIDNRLSIKQICFESGFNNTACFYKNFKEVTNKTPQEYLNKHMDADN